MATSEGTGEALGAGVSPGVGEGTSDGAAVTALVGSGTAEGLAAWAMTGATAKLKAIRAMAIAASRSMLERRRGRAQGAADAGHHFTGS